MAANTAGSNVSMSRIGEVLKEAREKKGLTVDQAQKQTRIHSTVLKALEEGKCDNILTPTYVKSFLKKYSDFLGLDTHQILKNYALLHPEAEMPLASKPESEGSPDISKALPVIKFALTAIVIIFLVVFLGGKVSSHFKKSPPAKSRAPAARLKTQSPQAPKMPGKKKSSPKFAASVAQISIPKTVRLKLLLKVKEPVFVKMKTDGVLLFERVLTKGTAEFFTADKRINIYLAKGEAVELILNGKFLGSPGKGLIRNLEITRDGVREK